MDPLQQSPTQPLPPATPVPPSRRVLSRFPRKWLGLIGLAIVLFLIGGALLLLPKQTIKKVPSPIRSQPPISSVTQVVTPSPTVSVDLQKAIDEAKNAANEYDTWQHTELTEYPWLRKFPLAGSNYYVYFDITKKTFYGRLYPKPGEDVEQIKKLVLQEFTTRQIPTTTYPIDWVVNP